jgi:hypothetical protein
MRSVTYSMGISLDDAELEWAALWKPLPKVVFSTTLSAVQGNARLAAGGLAEEIERLRAEQGEGDIAIGGATLAAEAAALDLIDEYRAMVYPVLVGGGIPFFPRRERRVDLELVERRGRGTYRPSLTHKPRPGAWHDLDRYAHRVDAAGDAIDPHRAGRIDLARPRRGGRRDPDRDRPYDGEAASTINGRSTGWSTPTFEKRRAVDCDFPEAPRHALRAG